MNTDPEVLYYMCVGGFISDGPQGFSPFPSPNTRSGYPLFPLSPSTFCPRSLPPYPLVIAFSSLPSGTEVSLLGHFSLLTFLSSVLLNVLSIVENGCNHEPEFLKFGQCFSKILLFLVKNSKGSVIDRGQSRKVLL